MHAYMTLTLTFDHPGGYSPKFCPGYVLDLLDYLPLLAAFATDRSLPRLVGLIFVITCTGMYPDVILS